MLEYLLNILIFVKLQILLTLINPLLAIYYSLRQLINIQMAQTIIYMNLIVKMFEFYISLLHCLLYYFLQFLHCVL